MKLSWQTWRPLKWACAALLWLAIIAAGRQTLAEQEAAAEANYETRPYSSPHQYSGPSLERHQFVPAANDVKQHQQQQQSKAARHVKKCTRQSIMLARQMLVLEFNHINNFMSMWFNDLDKEELTAGQRHSLANIVMSGQGARLLHPNGQPLIELESSYFRGRAPGASQHQHYNASGAQNEPATIKLIRRHQDRCSLNGDKMQFTYAIGLAIGPLEHHLDVVYNLPKDLGLGQPLDWRYGQIVVHVPKMIYEVTLKQMSNYTLNSLSPFSSNCLLEVSEVTYLAAGLPTARQPGQQHHTGKPQASITSSGLAANNQTALQLERLFDDHTRPTISRRLRQMLKFYLNTKTLPLASACADC